MTGTAAKVSSSHTDLHSNVDISYSRDPVERDAKGSPRKGQSEARQPDSPVGVPSTTFVSPSFTDVSNVVSPLARLKREDALKEKGRTVPSEESCEPRYKFDELPDADIIKLLQAKLEYKQFSGDQGLVARVNTNNGELLAIYNGDMKNGMPQGQGTLKFSQNEYYQGTWLEGLAHGEGVLETHSYRYKGCFREGQFDGQGWLNIKNKGIYEGGFMEGMFNGKGKFTWVDNHKVYVGGWKNNKFTGKGLMVWSDGRKFYGEYLNGKKHGKGFAIFPSPMAEPIHGKWFMGTKIKD